MNKLKQFSPVLIGLLAVLLLCFNSGGRDVQDGAAPPSTGSTVQDTQPAVVPEETGAKDALTRVEQALSRYALDETAMASCVYDGTLYADDSTTGAGRQADAHALASLCDEQRMNPIAAFWLLAEESLYQYAADKDMTVSVPAFALELQLQKEYPFSAEGTRQLLTDILVLSATVEDGMPMDTKLLGENSMVDADQVFYEEGDCYYSYFVYYGERSAHFLCFYTRGEEKIDELELQMLNLRYASGDEEQLNRIDLLSDRQAASLMAAAEQLLTGASHADNGRIPMSYSVGDYGITIERFQITGQGESGSLTNYAIRKAG